MVRPIIGEKELNITDLEVTPVSLKIVEESQQIVQVKGIAKLDNGEKVVAPVNDSIRFETTDEEVAIVDKKGKVTGVTMGTAEIVVTYKDIVKHIPVQVVDRGDKPEDKNQDEDNHGKKPGENDDPVDDDQNDADNNGEKVAKPENNNRDTEGNSSKGKDRSNNTSESTGDKADLLPNTSTPIGNYLLIGLGFVILGAVLFYVKRRKTKQM